VQTWKFNFQVLLYYIRPLLWFSGQKFLATDLQFWVRFPAIQDFLGNSGIGTGSTQLRDYGRRDLRWARCTNFADKPRSLDRYRQRTKATEFFFLLLLLLLYYIETVKLIFGSIHKNSNPLSYRKVVEITLETSCASDSRWCKDYWGLTIEHLLQNVQEYYS
jgi:hypothetical protein